MKPLCIELFAGSFGWSAGWLDLGGRAIGFDIEHCDHHGPVPDNAELVLQDVLTLNGRQFRNASLILGSPPCQAYSYRAMPWKRAKSLPPPSNELFDACFRIQREASEAAGHYIPMVVENVCGAQKWVGRARWHYGSYYLWGDVPALMPIVIRSQKFNPDGTSHPPGSWFAIADSKNRGTQKVPGFRFDGSGRSLETAAVEGQKGRLHGWSGGTWESDAAAPQRYREGIKQGGSGAEWFREPLQERRKQATAVKHQAHNPEAVGWFGSYKPGDDPLRNTSSKSNSRKAASAMIAILVIQKPSLAEQPAESLVTAYLRSPATRAAPTPAENPPIPCNNKTVNNVERAE